MKTFALAALLLFAAASPAPPKYHVARHIPLGGEGGWDYLTIDSPSHRLFISRGDHVVVLDVETAKVVGEIPKTDGVHGIAIARDLHRGFVSNGRLNTVTIFDLDSLKVTGEAKTAERPDAIMFDPVSSRVFTFNAGGKSSTAIDAKSTVSVARWSRRNFGIQRCRKRWMSSISSPASVSRSRNSATSASRPVSGRSCGS